MACSNWINRSELNKGIFTKVSVALENAIGENVIGGCTTPWITAAGSSAPWACLEGCKETVRRGAQSQLLPEAASLQEYGLQMSPGNLAGKGQGDKDPQQHSALASSSPVSAS